MAIGGTARQVFLAIVKGDSSQAVTEFNKLGKAVDKSTGQANTGLKRFTSMGKAALDEMTGLLKTPAGAAAAIGAVGTAAFKAAGQFSDLAKTALDVSKATGLSTEEASRWVAVGDDYGISAETVAAGIGKIAKTLDSDKWAKYGIETRNAAGEAKSANEVFLAALDLLGRTTNETERARIGNELFGKGYMALAPLIGKTGDEYRSLLNDVERGQVITSSEAQAGMEWKLAMDALQDSLLEVGNAVGGVVVEIAPMVSGIAKIVNAVTNLGMAADSEIGRALASNIESTGRSAIDLAFAFDKTANSAENLIKAGMADGTSLVRDTFEQLATESPKDAQKVYEAYVAIATGAGRGDQAMRDLASQLGITSELIQFMSGLLPDAATGMSNLAGATNEEADASDEAAKAAKRHSDAIQDAIDLRDELFGKAKSALDRQRDLTDTQNTYNKTLADAKSTTEEQVSAAFDLVESYATLTGAAEDSEVGIQRQIDKLDELLLTVQPGSPLYNALNEYKLQLAGIPAEVNTKLGLQTPSGAAFKLGFGTPTPAAPALQNIPLAGGITFKVYINNPVMSGQQIAEELAAYLRRSGAAYKLGFGG